MSYNKLAIAIDALTYVAMNSGEKQVSSKDICKELGLKLRYTESLMQAFVKAGILKSIRGVAGGYSIGRERRKITLLEVNNIVSSLQSTKQTTPTSKVSEDIMNEINSTVDQKLQNITLEEIYDKAVKLRQADVKAKKNDFVI